MQLMYARLSGLRLAVIFSCTANKRNPSHWAAYEHASSIPTGRCIHPALLHIRISRNTSTPTHRTTRTPIQTHTQTPPPYDKAQICPLVVCTSCLVCPVCAAWAENIKHKCDREYTLTHTHTSLASTRSQPRYIIHISYATKHRHTRPDETTTTTTMATTTSTTTQGGRREYTVSCRSPSREKRNAGTGHRRTVCVCALLPDSGRVYPGTDDRRRVGGRDGEQGSRNAQRAHNPN